MKSRRAVTEDKVKKYLKDASKTQQLQVKLEKNKNDIASPYILVSSLTLAPMFIFTLMRYLVREDLRLPQESLVNQMKLGAQAFNQYHETNRKKVEEPFTGRIDIEKAFTNRVDDLNKLKLSDLGELNEIILLDKTNHSVITQFIDGLMKKCNIILNCISSERMTNFQALNSETPSNSYETCLDLRNFAMRQYINSFNALQSLLSDFPKEINTDPKYRHIDPVLANLPIDFPVDFVTRKPHCERFPKPLYFQDLDLSMTTAAHIHDLIIKHQLLPDQRDTYDRIIKNQFITPQAVIPQRMLQELDQVADAISLEYGIAFAIIGSIFIHKFFTTRIIQHLFPLKYYLSDLSSTSSCSQLVAATNQKARTSRLLANAGYGLLLAVIVFAYFSTKGPFSTQKSTFIARFALPYTLGLIINMIYMWLSTQYSTYKLSNTLQTQREKLKLIFPDIELEQCCGKSINDSHFIVTVNEAKAESHTASIHLIEFTLEKFGIPILVSFWEQGKLLISAAKPFPVKDMQAYLKNFEEARQRVNQLIKQYEQLTAILKTYLCYHRIVYDKGLPIFQYVIGNTIPSNLKEILLPSGFVVQPNGVLVLELQPRQNLPETTFNLLLIQLKIALKSIAAQERLPHTETIRFFHRPVSTTTAVKSTEPRQVVDTKSDKLEQLKAVKTLSWHGVCGEETITNSDPRVGPIKGHHGNAHLLFRLTMEACSNDEKTYNSFFKKAFKIANTSLGSSGLKWYGDNQPKKNPDGSKGRVKAVSTQLGNVGLFIYAHVRSSPDETVLYYTDDHLYYGIHD